MSLLTDLHAITTALVHEQPSLWNAEVAPTWSHREGTLRDEPAVMTSHAWESPTLAWFRVAILHGGQRSKVYSVLGIPRPQYDLPLFGAEIVEITGSVTVVALDWMPLYPNSRHIAPLREIRARYRDFPSGGELPEWAANSFSPHALFSRPRDAIPRGRILSAYEAYLHPYLQAACAAVPTGDPEETLELQRRYCNGHFENDPGGAMLAKIFGSEWATAYAQAFLFRLHDSEQP